MRLISEIHIYPIKSLGGISLNESRVERRGFAYDRRWMLVDKQGQFVTQRQIPAMALMRPSISGDHLRVTAPTGDWFDIPLQPDAPALEKLRVQVWSQTCAARRVAADADQWFSDQLGASLRLVYMPNTTRRAADGRYAPSGQYVSFADGFPYLLIGQASLDELNGRLTQPVPMNRFRPNLVVTGGTAFEEDQWGDVKLGDQTFRCVKPCARCVMTTIDQQSAEKGSEPLRTLSEYRRQGNKVLFGQNVIWTGEGENATVRVGDRVSFI